MRRGRRTAYLVNRYLESNLSASSLGSPSVAELDSTTAALVRGMGGPPGGPVPTFAQLPPQIQQQIVSDWQQRKRQALLKTEVDRLKAEIKPVIDKRCSPPSRGRCRRRTPERSSQNEPSHPSPPLPSVLAPRRVRHRPGLVVAVAAPRAIAQSAAPVPSAAGERIDGVLATVNDEVILASEVEEQLYLYINQNRMRPDSAGVAQLRREILDRIIEEKVIVSEAKRLSITVPEAELEKSVTEAMDDVKKRLGTEAAYRSELAREGITEEDLRKRYRDDVSRQMMAQALLRRQLGKIEVTPNEAVAYYAAHTSEFPKRPAAMKVSVIQIPVEADSLVRRAVRQRAVDARRGSRRASRSRGWRRNSPRTRPPRAAAAISAGSSAGNSTRRSRSPRSRSPSARCRAWSRPRSAIT